MNHSRSISSAKPQFCSLLIVLLACIHVARSAEPLQTTRSENTFHLEPLGATLQVPMKWVEGEYNRSNRDRPLTARDHFHLTREELAEVREGFWQSDGSYGKIVNAVLPFEQCVFHAGDDGWGMESHSWADLQMRVYVGDWTVDRLKQLVKTKGEKMAQSLPERRIVYGEASVEDDSIVGWRGSVLTLSRVSYYDYQIALHVAFYAKQFGTETVVLVFMYASDKYQKKEIPDIVCSFTQL